MHDIAETPDTIRDFWFGWEADDAEVARTKSGLWWSKNEATDLVLRKRFASLVAAAGCGAIDQWSASPGGLLALILITDQIPRNIFRGSPRAFAFDRRARAWCKAGLDAGFDMKLRLIERVFFYMPLEHSENLQDQEASVRAFQDLKGEAQPKHLELFETYLGFAMRHREVVARFGRFPHRNTVLGRRSTPEEVEFLRQPNSSF